MGKDFTVMICNPERAVEWEAILGTIRVHVKSPIPSRANLPGHPDALIYELDLGFLDADQRQRLVAHLAEKFGFSEDEVEAALDEHGVPILAGDCVVSVTNPQCWF
jgi:hypothetical protein